MKKFTFYLSDGRSIVRRAAGLQNALCGLIVEDKPKPETVIGLDAAKPKFWIVRGQNAYPISAKAAATFAAIG